MRTTLLGLLTRSFRPVNLRRFPVQLLREVMNLHGILVRLFAKLVSDQLIFFAVGGGRCGVRVRGKVVEFCNALVWSL